MSKRLISYTYNIIHHRHTDNAVVVMKSLISDRCYFFRNNDILLPAVILCKNTVFNNKVYTVIIKNSRSVPIKTVIISCTVQCYTACADRMRLAVSCGKRCIRNCSLIYTAIASPVTLIYGNTAVRCTYNHHRVLRSTTASLNNITNHRLRKQRFYISFRHLRCTVKLTEHYDILIIDIFVTFLVIIRCRHIAVKYFVKCKACKTEALDCSAVALEKCYTLIWRICRLQLTEFLLN